jgi:primosomal replication protein N
VPDESAPATDLQPINRLILTAQLVERGAMRYTPAGLPALDLRLQHESTVTEDGQPRKVSMEIKALGIGAITSHLSALPLGSQGIYAGFLGATRNGRGLLFHITALA